MFFKWKKINDKIDKINETLTEANIKEISYVLGNKKEMLKRNLIARYIKRHRYWNRCNINNSNYCIFYAKINKTKYTNFRRLYKRYN